MKSLRSALGGVLLVPALLLIAHGATHAQANGTGFVQNFAGGTVLLASGDTIEGPITFHRSEDVILVTMPDQTVSTLAAVAVQSFAVKGEQGNNLRQYDNFYTARQGYYHGNPGYNRPAGRRVLDAGQVRIFRVYRWNRGNDYSDFRSPAFFEQISGGPNVLLRRETLIQRPMNYASPYGYGMGAYGMGMPRTIGYYTDVKDAFYLGLPDGNVLSLRNPKKDLLNAFRQQSKLIDKYAKENQLDYTKAQDLAYIINYANSLPGPK